MAHGEGGRTIVVSNRGPVTFTRGESGEREYSRGAGGLVTALNSVLRHTENAVWIASAQSEEDVAVSKEPAPYEVEDLRVRLVDHDQDAYDLMYNELANPLLWFVQHGLYDLPYSPALGDETRRAWEEGYIPVNRNFADAVVETAADQHSPTILLHDYQLYMTPLFVRERLGASAFLSLFVHIPWPEPDLWRVLPHYVREGVLESLLSADVVAFHTKRYARAFAETAADILGAEAEGGVIRYRGREVWVRAYPISIDPGEFEDLAQREDVLQQERFVKGLPGKLLLRVDRTDLSKNVVRGFLAYGRMLERHPEMRGEVTFLAQLQPSRTDVREYAAYMEAVGTTAEEVNEEAAVINEKNGVLVLSENAGAHEELGEYALTVNPYDIDEQADSIYAALTMPEEERGHRAKALREAVDSNTIEDWVEAQIQDIEAYRGRR